MSRSTWGCIYRILVSSYIMTNYMTRQMSDELISLTDGMQLDDDIFDPVSLCGKRRRPSSSNFGESKKVRHQYVFKNC